MFFGGTVHKREEAIRGASLIVQGRIQTSASTKMDARAYLDKVYEPRHVPVPLHLVKLSELKPWEFSLFLRLMTEGERNLVLRLLDLET